MNGNEVLFFIAIPVASLAVDGDRHLAGEIERLSRSEVRPHA